MREIDFDKWLEEYEKRRGAPPKHIKRIMEEPPKPGKVGILPWESGEDV